MADRDLTVEKADIAAAHEKRDRKNKKRIDDGRYFTDPTNFHGMTLPSARRSMRRVDREERKRAFNHFGTAGAKLRNNKAKEGWKKVPVTPFTPTEDNPDRHIHPRHLREVN